MEKYFIYGEKDIAFLVKFEKMRLQRQRIFQNPKKRVIFGYHLLRGYHGISI